MGLPGPCGLGKRAKRGGYALRDRALHLLRYCAALAWLGPQATAPEGAGPGIRHHDTLPLPLLQALTLTQTITLTQTLNPNFNTAPCPRKRTPPPCKLPPLAIPPPPPRETVTSM